MSPTLAERSNLGRGNGAFWVKFNSSTALPQYGTWNSMSYSKDSQLLHSFFMQAPVGICVLEGPEHVITLANSYFYKILGWNRNIIGLSVRAAFPELEGQGFFELCDKVFQTGESYVGQDQLAQISLEDGSKKEIYSDFIYQAKRDPEGNINGIFVVCTEVTSRVLANKALEVAKELAERANLAKSVFLSNMSHEIRTPLAAILGFSELLKNSSSPEEKAEYMNIMNKNGRVLTSLIDDILDLAKVEAGHLNVENTSFDLAGLVKEVVDTFQEVISKKKLKVEIQIASNFPEFVTSDSVRLRQILVNLLGNATKFTSQGEINIFVRHFTFDKDNIGVEIKIKDSGVGVAAEHIGHLFEPFTQADSSTTRRFGGTGLGLALSRKIARLLGGDVNIHSLGLGKGCTAIFRVIVKAANGVLFAEETGSIEKTNKVKVPTKKINVLLVEDNHDNQELIALILKTSDFEVDIANDGEEAVNMAMTNSYDVILMDMQMPVLDGYAATTQLRSHGYNKPIIALTAHAMKEDILNTKKVGCNAHIAKPIDADKLLKIVQEFSEL